MVPIAGYIVGCVACVSCKIFNCKLLFRKLKSKISNVIKGLFLIQEAA